MEGDTLTERVQVIETRVDGLVESVAPDTRRFAAVDGRLERVPLTLDEACRAQRQYLEFVHAQLDAKLTAGFSRVEGHLERLERKIDRVIELLSARG